MKNFFLLFLLLLSFSANSAIDHRNPSHPCLDKTIWGKIEKATLVNKNITLDAKLDTGASMSSLSATQIKFFNYYHKQWVQFNLLLPHREVPFIEPVVGMIRVKRREDETMNSYTQEYNRRPVISLKIKIGGKTKELFVNLVDRKQFHYPLLIGSDALEKYDVLIDAKRNYLSHKE